MIPYSLTRFASPLALALLAVATLPAGAQNVLQRAKGTPQLPGRPSETSGIPPGVDGGTAATSNSVPLGTPTVPANERERNEIRKAAAAARAAARPRALPASAPLAAAAGSAVAGARPSDAITAPGGGGAKTATTSGVKSGVGDCAAAAAAARTASGAMARRTDKPAGCP